MLSSKRLQCVFRMSVVTLIALGTYSFTPAQIPQTQEQIQGQSQQNSANQKSSGGFFRGLFGVGDSQKNTNQHVAPANAAQPTQQSQPIPQQQYVQQVQPPRPNSGAYSPTGPAMGSRPQAITQNYQQSATQVSASQQYGTAQPISRQMPSQSVANTFSNTNAQSASPANSLERLQQRLQINAPNVEITSPNSSTNHFAGVNSGLPSPPSVAGSEPEQKSTAATPKPQKTIAITPEKIASADLPSISTDRNVRPTDTTPVKNSSAALATPPDVSQDADTLVPEAETTTETKPDSTRGVPVRNTTPPQERGPSPLPSQRPTPVAKPEEPRPISKPKTESGLITQQSPVLSVEANGPNPIIFGKEETYTFIVTNDSSVTAEAVVINIDLPRWATNTQAPELSNGSNTLLPHQVNNEDYGVFQWQVGTIAPGKSETLKLHIVVNERRPFELNWSYGFKPRATQAKIDVQQPVIKMEFDGPNEVIWGSEESYQLKIKNIGNGNATEVALKLSTSGVVKAETVIDSLTIGEERTLDVIVEALEQDMDELQIKVEATGPYGLSEETSKRVVIKRAAPELVVDAPPNQFVDNAIEYVLIARNLRTTASLSTVIEATLPLGVEYVSSTRGGEFDPDTKRVRWDVGTLSIGGEYVCTVVCEAKREGECRLDAKITEKTGLVQSASAATYVEAIADLVLEIDKPPLPIEVGIPTEFVVTVINRGSKGADNIEVGLYFAEEIEPLSIESGRGNVSAEHCEVVFDTIPVLPARDKMTFKVKGRGLEPGSHKVKAILVCQSTETELSSQVNAKFYQGRNSNITSHPRAAETQIARGYRTSLTPGVSSQDERTTYPSSLPSNRTSTVPTMPGQPPPQKSSQVFPPSTTNPLANSGLPSIQLIDASSNEVPVMQIPEMTYGQQPVSAPVPALGTTSGGTAPNRLPRTSTMPTLSPPPVME